MSDELNYFLLFVASKRTASASTGTSSSRSNLLSPETNEGTISRVMSPRQNLARAMSRR